MIYTSFVIENPMGAVRTTQRQKWVDPKAKQYHRYKNVVRLIANLHGIPSELEKCARVEVDIDVRWKGRALADLDNVVKGILDALWRQDRRVNVITARHSENFKSPGPSVAIVTVTVD